MEKFTASNGIEIVRHPYAFVIRVPNRPDFTVPFGGESALREFFLAERDAELGRWRWSEDPNYTVQRFSETEVLVLFEPSGRSWVHDRLSASRSYGVMTGAEAAAAYFVAHPEPRPWEDAKPGEVWIVTDKSGEHPYAIDSSQFYDASRDYPLDFTDRSITAARRIWPEGETTT